jgi:glutathione S-transferase
MITEPFVLHVDARHLSPYAMSAFVALVEKGLPFTEAPVDLAAGAQHGPAFRAISATRRVPTLEHGAFRLAESTAIAEYLEDLVPQPRLFPADPRHRATARQVQAWLRSDLMPIRVERPTEVVFLGERRAPLSAAALASAERLVEAAGALLAHGGEHLFGDWCLADTDLALMLQRLVRGGDPLPAPLAAYADRQWSRPSVARWCAGVRA